MIAEPPFEAFSEKYAAGVSQAIVRRIVSDFETPVAAFLKLAGRRKNVFLLESVEGGERLGRYSIIGVKPDAIWRARNGVTEINWRAAADAAAFEAVDAAPIASLKSFVAQSTIDLPPGCPPMAAGIFGFLGYDMARLVEHLPDRPGERFGIEDAIFLRPTLTAVFDNVRQEISLVATARCEAGLSARAAYDRALERIEEAAIDLAAPLTAPRDLPHTAAPEDIDLPRSSVSPQRFREMVLRAKEHIAAGDIFQVVLSQVFSAPFPRRPFELYRALRRLNPSPFLFFLEFDNFALAGSSPEILVRVQAGEVTIRPIAGTRRRGETVERDNALEVELLADPKERAEHLMLLDLGRNDVGRSAEIGSVKVTQSFIIERYSHVMHIVSNVVGRLRAGMHPLDAVMAGFPAGTVTGAPKIRAMEIIDSLEDAVRGPYGGAVGYFAPNGDIDTCIALRTALLKDGAMYVQAGAGVVADSDPEAEDLECRNKARALFAAAKSALF